MRSIISLSLVGLTLMASPTETKAQERLNPMIERHERGESLFGLYAPANSRGRRGAEPAAEKTPLDLARETLGVTTSDYIFSGSMEGGVDRALPEWSAYVAGLMEAGATARTHPLVVKSPKIGTDTSVLRDIGTQLNSGVSALMFVEVESAAELRSGLAAMRFRSQGGTRSDNVGNAPAYWGVSEAAYRQKADLWPVNPEGELINWTIVESHEGLANVREIAAVEGIGVLWPGAGTLRGLFSVTDAEGRRTLDQEAWEASIQKVLAACKEFDVPCGFPANASDIEMRIEQGFTVFVMGWGEGGFSTIDVGRRAAGR
ncbi:MAG: aldolase/citrate lyase family protein [Gemmatimonadetes bacterium]|nr:aldolase/citrate lyase family protein [Gemmatimonadota bacterium]MDA1102295.1 aldolase/citrate lyase family protein [Gemmatimonadota bacterium]